MSGDIHHFDVALSFAGEDREYVEEVALALREMGIRVFYDKYERVTLWGKDLYSHLQEIYQKLARFAVIFISKNYAEKVWTNHERRSAQARALSETGEYILPARFDDTEIPGVLPTVGYVDLNEFSPDEFAALVNTKNSLQNGKSTANLSPQNSARKSITIRLATKRIIPSLAVLSVITTRFVSSKSVPSVLQRGKAW